MTKWRTLDNKQFRIKAITRVKSTLITTQKAVSESDRAAATIHQIATSQKSKIFSKSKSKENNQAKLLGIKLIKL